MSPSDTVSDAIGQASTATAAKTRPFYWSLRRELWENRAIVIAPLAAAAVVLFGFLVGAVNFPHLMGSPNVRVQIEALNASKAADVVAAPFGFASAIILITAFVTGFFYCLGALYGERRDRSILFWKSLPVSDWTTVLAKVVVVLVVLPVVTFVVVTASEAIMLAVAAAALPAAGPVSRATLSAAYPFGSTSLVLLYLLACLSLWYAPIWGWALMVSAWARRVTFLWAVGPPLAACVFEALAFHTGHAWSLLKLRVGGVYGEALVGVARGQVVISPSQMDPLGFVTRPGLWLGLVACAVFLGVAIWLRRRRDPI